MDDKNLTQRHNSRVYENFLMHWKYIKREKVGDKWKYTYKDDNVGKAQKKPTDVKSSVGKVKNWMNSLNSTKEKTIPEKIIKENVITENTIPEKIIKENVITENTIPEKIIKEKTIKEDIIPNKTVPMTDHERQVIKKAEKKTEPKVSEEYKEEVEFNSKKNAYPNGMTPQDVKKTYTKLEDFLGKDERDALLDADSKKKAADEKFKKANESNEYSKYVGYDEKTGDMIKLPGYDEEVNKRDDAMNKAKAEQKEASKELRETLDAFFKTPYGMLYQAESTIDDGRAAVGNALEKLAKKLKTPKANLYKY